MIKACSPEIPNKEPTFALSEVLVLPQRL